jgi:hypothetical protein
VTVVLSVVPSTSTGAPVVTAVTETGLDPCSRVMEDVSLTVTCWPADVASVKPAADTLPAMPTAVTVTGDQAGICQMALLIRLSSHRDRLYQLASSANRCLRIQAFQQNKTGCSMADATSGDPRYFPV